jgi:hypothetical protein
MISSSLRIIFELLTPVLLERVLHINAFDNIFFHAIIRFNKARQEGEEFRKFLLWNDDYAIGDIAENQISRFHNSTVNIQWDLGGMGFCLGAASNNGFCFGPDLNPLLSADVPQNDERRRR